MTSITFRRGSLRGRGTTSTLTSARPAATDTARTPTGDDYRGRSFVALILVLGSLAMIGPVTIDTYLPALPQIATQFHASDAQVQLTLTAVLLGLGLGQLAFGPLSDAIGRRRPLIVGLIAHGIASLACAIAPSIGFLTAARFAQGLAGAALSVASSALIRDLFSGHRLAEIMSRLFLVTGLAPIIAPVLGSAILARTSWPGIFLAVAAFAGILTVLGLRKVPETLAVDRRIGLDVGDLWSAYRSLLSDRVYLAMVGTASLAFSALLAYVGGSSFILQDVFDLDPTQFGLVFGANSLGLTLAMQLNPWLVRRFGPARVLRGAVRLASIAGLAILGCATTGLGGIYGFLVPVSFLLMGVACILPNASVMALQRHGESAGTASAVIGAAQFAAAAIATPLVGALANGTAAPVGIIGSVAMLTALVLVRLTWRELKTQSFG